MNYFVVAVPASQVERSPAILTLLVEIAFDRNESAYHGCVAIQGTAVEGIGTTL